MDGGDNDGRYVVVWGADASNAMAEVYGEALYVPGGFEAVPAMSAEVERQLRLVPLDVGESREPGVRFMTEDRPSVEYEPFEDVRFVFIRRANFYTPKGTE